MTDFEHFILPDQFTQAIVWLGLIASLVPVFVTPREAIIGATLGYGIFWAVDAIYYYYRGFHGMYPGDFKLNAGIGACLGLKWLMIILIVSVAFILAATIIRFILGQNGKNGESLLHQEAPYGCYSSIVTVAVLYISLSDLYA